MLSAVRVSRHHGAHVVLDDVSLSVGPGSRTGVIGPNGIGKSTLLRVLAGIEAPDTGTVERAPASLTVGYLPQEPEAVPGETLAAFLDGVPGGVVVVSHDRAFLDRSVTRIVEIEEESHRAREFAGGWTDFVEARALTRRQGYEAYEKYVARRNELNARIRTQKQWAVKGVKAA